MNYAVVDIETNGGVKITEISIFIFDGNEVIDEFTTLINPGTFIPQFITNLTGITNQMVRQAPKFEEVAKKIHEITENCVFVAHNVNFDYGIISKEFNSLGFKFKRKKLCTVRLSRKLIPNRNSYSLGEICSHQNIEIKDRHRAKGDAEATVILLQRLLALDENGEVVQGFLKANSKEATLPPLLSKDIFNKLPQKHGVYYFWNVKKEIIYVGKANNLKQRVLSHFHDKKKKEIEMCMLIANITFEETGNELIALLLESSEIKRYYPKFNRAQKKKNPTLSLFSYEDRKGIIHLAWNNSKIVKDSIRNFYSIREARLFLEELCKEYELCPKYCHLQTTNSSCFDYTIEQCKGICIEKEAIEDYNDRVLQAIKSLAYDKDELLIKLNGRNSEEISFVLISENSYKGFGYLNKKEENNLEKAYLESLINHKETTETKKIIGSFIKNNTDSFELIPIM
ncbi:DNA polymerase III subunit epsilon [Tenacibaculum holothuriorum]|uniref:DNA polymerase III subunit epsilon n=1 Tax=Tenacibaculum holothuriorum TaxID=1635173 RepID=A0A1Y2PFK7_9FLAO|nr:exonuclease domain-containing protein [Tenacibaculum holothuriorum]OSY89264.1 DNA polymerase III subunit epsilon [Tenacibaculum holothuriorum]